MSFVPVTGTATFRAGQPPRDGVVEFRDERRTVALPIRAALPVLTKAHSRDDLHPSVGLLSGAALLGLRLVAAGQIEPAGSEPSWRVGPLGAEDEDRVLRLAAARTYDGMARDAAEDVVRAMLDAVADSVPRAAPTPRSRPAMTRPDFERRLRERLARYAEPRPELPQLVRISLRVEADEEELVAGSVRLVLQVHDEQNPLHLCDAAVLWTGDGQEHGFGDRARTHAAIALRGAAEAWPVLDRLLELRVPDQITLDGAELESLL
ncbi:MAG: ATP-dependent helicase, partial [Friedmanniella sp.]